MVVVQTLDGSNNFMQPYMIYVVLLHFQLLLVENALKASHFISIIFKMYENSTLLELLLQIKRIKI